jgi:hypothetical protein
MKSKNNKPIVDDIAIAKVLSNKISFPAGIIIGHLEGLSQNRLLNLKSTLGPTKNNRKIHQLTLE